jgi:protocatechuate 3,4-dioxygenase beta subunit
MLAGDIVLSNKDGAMTSLNRRRLLAAAAMLPVTPIFAQTRALTCGDLTAAQTEGPFFKTRTPLRASLLEAGSKAPRLVVIGQVLSARCTPVANALLDFWHADEDGEYDNTGFRYRGHQFTDSDGRYRLVTIVPAEYPGRARHIHVKVQAPGKRVLTTQLYFRDEPGNRRDGLYRPELEMRMAGRGAGEGRFDFVVEA